MATRRDFLKNSALVTAGVFVAPALVAQTLTGKRTQVIIIGGGLAGLAAARVLKQRGIGYTVLEAQQRLGGRVFSHRMGDLVVELGGEWIGESHERMRALCEQYKLELLDNRMESGLIYQGQYHAPGTWDYSPAWKSRFGQLLQNYGQLSEADKKKLDQYDWWRYLVNNGCDGRDLMLRELSDSTDFGESIRHVSAYAALSEYAESSEHNEMDFKIKGGNVLLADRIADDIGRNNILTQHQVVRITQNANGVRVHCANGRTLDADNIICALPTFAIRNIIWEPGLPQDKIDAINALQYARINKHALRFSKRFWGADAFDLLTDQLPHYFYHATKFQSPESGVLISYSIGDKAAVIANQTAEWNAAQIRQTLQPHFGDVSRWLAQQENFYWGGNPYTHGAYALYGPGQWFNLMPVLQHDFMHTSFAGEHIAMWQGFMEGAVATGESAAQKI